MHVDKRVHRARSGASFVDSRSPVTKLRSKDDKDVFGIVRDAQREKDSPAASKLCGNTNYSTLKDPLRYSSLNFPSIGRLMALLNHLGSFVG